MKGGGARKKTGGHSNWKSSDLPRKKQTEALAENLGGREKETFKHRVKKVANAESSSFQNRPESHFTKTNREKVQDIS